MCISYCCEVTNRNSPAYARTMVRLWQSVFESLGIAVPIHETLHVLIIWTCSCCQTQSEGGGAHLQGCHLVLQSCLLCLHNIRCASVQLASLEVTDTVQKHLLGAGESRPIRCPANTA